MSDAISGVGRAIARAGLGMTAGVGTAPALGGANSGVAKTNFADTLKQFVNDVSDQQDNAADYAQRFMRGEPVELHQVMASAEEASVSLQMLVSVRNKVLDAYHTIVNMQS